METWSRSSRGLKRALRSRPVPSSTEGRLRFLLKAHRGSTRRVAAVLGVSQRTVQRWVTKKPAARHPPGPLEMKAIEEAVLARWQPPGTGPPACPGRGGRLRLPYQGAIRVRGSGRVLGRCGCGGSPSPCQERSAGSCSPAALLTVR
ncbi:helix-turn-helix domain-containing protein [Streptomyces sp. NPDC096012]|uniref:helix-turn-helix domain-containing protein n=1 Tax=Streptomyces sp. NPDC096012 TaxID=3155684 RepID=UPI00336A1493